MRKLHKKPEGTPKYRGVTWDSKRGMWLCRIMVGGDHRSLGYFSDPYVAACEYDKYKVAIVAAGGHFQRKAKTNAELGLIPHITPEEYRLIVG